MQKKKTSVTIRENGVVLRKHNKRITITENENGGIIIGFDTIDKDAKLPAILHSHSKGVIRHTIMGMSEEGMADLFLAYEEYCLERKKNKDIE